jgi:Na+/proline symporter
MILAFILVYIGLQLGIAWRFRRRTETEGDYLLAGRALGPWMATFAVFATWFGAETCIGAAGEAYRHGLSGVLADPFGYALGMVLVGVVIAVPLWRRGVTTLADLFRIRYGAGVERLAALVMIPSSLLWAAAQVRAFGQVLASASEWGLLACMTLAAVVVIIYTAFGGMWSDAVTDLVQGLVLIAGLLALAVVFFWQGGETHLAALPAERLNPLHERSGWDALETLLTPVFSTLAAQELASRVLAMRSAHLARGATLAGAGLYLALGSIPLLLGLAAVSLMGEGLDPEQVLTRYAAEALPWPLYVLFLCALVSAILSTLSGALLVAGSLAAHNVLLPLRPQASERFKLAANRTAVVVFGIVAYGLALGSDSVYGLVEEAAGFGSAGVFVLVMASLWRRDAGSPWAATMALLAGTISYVLGAHVFDLETPYLVALASAMLGYGSLAFVYRMRKAPPQRGSGTPLVD